MMLASMIGTLLMLLILAGIMIAQVSHQRKRYELDVLDRILSIGAINVLVLGVLFIVNAIIKYFEILG